MKLKGYKHLTELDRTFLKIMLERGYSKAKIAFILKVHRSTIYREIKRNSLITTWTRNEPFYLSSSAQKQYLRRRKRTLAMVFKLSNKFSKAILFANNEEIQYSRKALFTIIRNGSALIWHYVNLHREYRFTQDIEEQDILFDMDKILALKIA